MSAYLIQVVINKTGDIVGATQISKDAGSYQRARCAIKLADYYVGLSLAKKGQFHILETDLETGENIASYTMKEASLAS